MLEVPSKYGVGDQKFCTPARAAMGGALSVGCGLLGNLGLGGMQDFACVISSTVVIT